MNSVKPDETDIRPWYREPWPWVIIAIPLLTILASGFTFYLAVTNPDYLVVEEEEYNATDEELRPSLSTGSERSPDGGNDDH